MNGTPVSKPSRAVGVDTVLTFPKDDVVRIVKVLGLGARRGPAPEAQALYEDLTPSLESRVEIIDQRVGGRPTKKDRRNMDILKGSR